ncbi:MAG: hypothetical protein JNM58_11305 [Xanthomonadaceae bacterium]|nr:hypothetical protein [Xanthomonadaceae bacterium]
MNDRVAIAPFDRLLLPAGESLVWTYYNRTFHRMDLKGIAITEKALYLCSLMPFVPFLGRWRCVGFDEIRGIEYMESRFGRPTLVVHLDARTEKLCTPFDMHKDEMAYDRQCLREAVDIVQRLLDGCRKSPTLL